MPQGFVYVLVSPNSDYIKIGGTEQPIGERLRGINGAEAYAERGPWQLSDFLHVTDWRLVEAEMHRHFGDRNIKAIGARELFSVGPYEARQKLRSTDVSLRINHDKTLALFLNTDVRLFLYRLFELSGLFGNLDIQGAWTLTSMPSTSGGRWFTLSIGSHEVAFTPRQSYDGEFFHHIVLDRLILEYPDTIMWIGRRDGDVQVAHYVAAERAVLVSFREDFAGAERFFRLSGVRRAVAAYWADALIDLRERRAKSVYARYHSYDAVAELIEYKRATENIFCAAGKE